MLSMSHTEKCGEDNLLNIDVGGFYEFSLVWQYSVVWSLNRAIIIQMSCSVHKVNTSMPVVKCDFS